MALELPFGIRTTVNRQVDEKYGGGDVAYNSIASALFALPKQSRFIGLTVGVQTDGGITEYWFQSGIEDCDLVLKGGAAETEKVVVSHDIEITNSIGRVRKGDTVKGKSTLHDLLVKMLEKFGGISDMTVGSNFEVRDENDVYTVGEMDGILKGFSDRLKTVDNTPVGTIRMFAGQIAPTGWMVCNGNILKTNDYPELYKIIGQSFTRTSLRNYYTSIGQFNLPDFNGRFPYGSSDIGDTGGRRTVTLTANEMPAHKHINGAYLDEDPADSVYGCATGLKSGSRKEGSRGSTVSPWTSTEGKGQPFDIMPPYMAVNFIIKVKS